MPDLDVRYRLADRLPGDSPAMLDGSGARVDVWMSRAYSLEDVAAALDVLAPAYCRAAHVQQVLRLAEAS